MKKLCVFVPLLLLITVTSFSQLRDIPKIVKENFARQYPTATDVNYDDDLTNVNVKFTLEGEKMNAEYSNKGIWKHTEKEWTYDKLPDAVKDGFKKSKYSDREIKDVVVLYYPADITQYRIKTEKNTVEKKYLFFNPEGKLLRDSITL
ncbi:MAG: PepSY-like domain-containing protein [Chitinophagaceae bacterium]